MKKIYRSKTDRKIAGVAGGLGAYFAIDPTIIRIIFITLLIMGGIPGIILYSGLWWLMPEEN